VTDGWLDRINAADERLFRRAARAHTPILDKVLPRLTHAADHGLIWLGAAGVLAVTGTRGRRAALRGLTSLGVASAIVNGPFKYATRRERPPIVDVPQLRLLAAQPRTTSFPSGHSASAAAFATGVALEAPIIGIPVGLAALGVAYGRVHTGVHYPGDVLVGVACGVTAALVVRGRWPVRPAHGAEAARADAPALADGEGLVVVVNAEAGGGADQTSGRITELLPAAEVVVVEGEKVPTALAEAVERGVVLGVAGGDGTVSRAVAAALGADLPLAVFPAGTLNHFTADLGLDDVAETAEAVRRGEAIALTVASTSANGDGDYFVNTFSVGVYPELVRQRERRERWLGKWGALLVALFRVLGRADTIELSVDGERRNLWLLFAGNGHYLPAGFAPSWRERLDQGVVDVRMVDADQPWGRTRLVGAVLSGRLGRCRVYEERQADRVRLSLSPGETLARDGETFDAPTELVLRSADRRLVVYRPAG
jgi:diacylglycerol kinase family enzyme/membrane-associated phospholipid phosphatase